MQIAFRDSLTFSMATLIQSGRMILTENTWREPIARKSSSKTSLWVRMAGRKPRPMALMGSREDGSFQEQEHVQEMLDLSACSGSDVFRRRRSVAGEQSLEQRTEESSTGGRREFIASSLFLYSLSALPWSSTEGSGAAAAVEDTMMTTVTLYSKPLAFNPAKAKLAPEEHGIEYTEKEIDIFGGESLEPWYLKINPNSSVPTLVAGNETITASADIVKWADEQEKGPLGGDKVDKEFIGEWISKVDAWDGNLFLAAFSSLGAILDLSTEHKIKVAWAYAKRYPDLAELYTRKTMTIKTTGEESMDKAKGESNRAQLVTLLDEAETRLSKTKYLVGDKYSNTDVIFTPCLYRIPMVNLDKELLEPRECLAKYWLKLKKRPNYQKTFGVSDIGLSTATLILLAFGKIYFSKLTRQY